jgi:DNA polymerase V
MNNGGDKTIPGISVGFPNPALESADIPLDLNKLVVKNPISTFYFRVAGDDWASLSINRGDILVIDRSLEPTSKQLVLFAQDGQFLLDKFDNIDSEAELFGVITFVLKKVS